MKNLALHWKILIGMVLGILVGILCSQSAAGSKFITNWIAPFGDIFIRLLKLIAIPLIIASLIKGISDLQDISKFSKIGFKTIVIYLITTFIAITIGLTLVNIIQPGNFISEDTVAALSEQYRDKLDTKLQSANVNTDTGPLKFLVDMVPDNLFAAAMSNKNMLQVIFFVILFGIALLLVDAEKRKPVKEFFDSLNEVVMKIIDLIMLFAPIGVFALMASIIVSTSDPDVFIALASYAGTVVLGLGLLIIVYFIIVRIFTGKKPSFFFNGISPAQLLAFSTSSSAATLPVTMERVEEHLGVEKEIASFVCPVGATINMDGTSLYQAVAAVFICQAMNFELSFTAQLSIILTATLASIGSAAVPSAGMVMLIAILEALKVPKEVLMVGLTMVFAVDRPLDMLRTVINVTGDATVSMVVAKSEGKLHDPKPKQWDDHYEK